MSLDITKIDFNKGDGLIPTVIQHSLTNEVLMLGYMNEEALKKTISEDKVTFYSRSKERLWTKGESSGNYLLVDSIVVDCDQDTLLIQAIPKGPTCHTGTSSCFGEGTAKGFVYQLEQIINDKIDNDDQDSYTNKLYKRGINKIAQKVGEEAVEIVIEAKDNNDELFLNEGADLMYHLLILLKAKGKSLTDIEEILRSRNS